MIDSTQGNCVGGGSAGPLRQAVLVINCGSSSVKYASTMFGDGAHKSSNSALSVFRRVVVSQSSAAGC